MPPRSHGHHRCFLRAELRLVLNLVGKRSVPIDGQLVILPFQGSLVIGLHVGEISLEEGLARRFATPGYGEGLNYGLPTVHVHWVDAVGVIAGLGQLLFELLGCLGVVIPS